VAVKVTRQQIRPFAFFDHYVARNRLILIIHFLLHITTTATTITLHERVEIVHVKRVTDISQRFSVGSLFHEAKDKVLNHYSGNSYHPEGCNAPSTSQLSLKNVCSDPGYTEDNDAGHSGNAQSCWSERLEEAEATAISSTTEFDAQAVGNVSAVENDSPENPVIANITTNHIDCHLEQAETGNESSKVTLSARIRNAQCREKPDKERRVKWRALYDRAMKLKQLMSEASPGCCDRSAVAIAPMGTSQLSRGPAEDFSYVSITSLEQLKLFTISVGDEFTATAVEAQAIIDEACCLPNYTNAPGENFAEAMRVHLGEIAAVSKGLLYVTRTNVLA
jgi:hypothetical protein